MALFPIGVLISMEQQSELIVPSDHLALRNTEAIKEVERILRTYY